MTPEIQIIKQQIRECFGRVTYTHKTHEKCADIYLETLNSIKNWQIFLAAVTTGSVFADLLNLFNLGFEAKVISGLSALVLLVLNAYSKSYNLGEFVQMHRDTAIQIWKLREEYLSLLTDIEIGILNINQIVAKRDILQNNLELVYKSAPPTFADAYTRAQEALKIKEELTFSDSEIDQFLPSALRKSS
jgi:hypothetical protein